MRRARETRVLLTWCKLTAPPAEPPQPEDVPMNDAQVHGGSRNRRHKHTQVRHLCRVLAQQGSPTKTCNTKLKR